MKKSLKLAGHMVISNIAIGLCRNSKYHNEVLRYLKIFMMVSRSLPSSQISGSMYNTVVSS